MAQHDLKVKIRRIWKWTLIGIIIFLVVSFFLKSSYPITHHKFNFADAYDVLKDTLTLAAAFLAPVAAFVLFDDWRTSHRLKNNETEVIEILKKVKNIPFRAKDLAKDLESFYENNLTKQEIEDYENKAFAISAEILAELGNINFSKKNFVNIKFH
ncbi:TPA: hypothetical protein ACJK69_003424, partial [Acinetobacter baumannii]